MSANASSDVSKQVKHVHELWKTCLKNKDAAGLSALFTNDGVLEFPGVRQMSGQAAVKTHYQKMFQAQPAHVPDGVGIEYTSSGCICDAGCANNPQLCEDFGQGVRKYPNKDGTSVISVNFQYTMTVVKEAQNWKIRVMSMTLTDRLPEEVLRAIQG